MMALTSAWTMVLRLAEVFIQMISSDEGLYRCGDDLLSGSVVTATEIEAWQGKPWGPSYMMM